MAVKSKSDVVRVGVVGVGIGQAHIKGYLQSPQAQIVALCDVNEERARQVAAGSGLNDVEFYTDHKAMLKEADLDAVSVCLPNILHRPIAVDCLNAGKHVLCEKPLAMSAADGQKIAAAAEKSGKNCMVGQVKRFSPEGLFLKQAIAAGEIGRPYYAKAVWLRKRGIPGYGGWFTTKAMSGGGPLIDIGVHLLDAAWWLAGCPKPVSVTGSTYAEFGPYGKGTGTWGVAGGKGKKGTFDVEDLAVGLIRFDNGLTINLEVSWALNNEREDQAVQLFSREGGCKWSDSVSLFRDINDVPTITQVDTLKGDAWQNQIQHFVDSVINGTTPDPDVHQGVSMMKMLDAIYKSAATGREVVIK